MFFFFCDRVTLLLSEGKDAVVSLEGVYWLCLDVYCFELFKTPMLTSMLIEFVQFDTYVKVIRIHLRKVTEGELRDREFILDFYIREVHL